MKAGDTVRVPSTRPPFRVKTIFFDSAGTLVDVPPYSTIWHRIMQTLGLGFALNAVEKAVAQADSSYGQRYYSYHGRTGDYWEAYLGLILTRLRVKGYEQSAIIEEIVRRFQEHPWSSPYPETRAILDSLKRRGFALGVISNATDEVAWRLDCVGLGEYFDAITCSQEARAEKPDSRIFRLALGRMGCEPGQAVHVGDSYETDVVGARKAGIQPILVDRLNKARRLDCPRIASLMGLNKLVQDWSET